MIWDKPKADQLFSLILQLQTIFPYLCPLLEKLKSIKFIKFITLWYYYQQM